MTQNTWAELKEQLGEEATDEEITNLFCEEYQDIVFWNWLVPKEPGTQIFYNSYAQKCSYLSYIPEDDNHYIIVHDFKGVTKKAKEALVRYDREYNIKRITDHKVLKFEKLDDESPWAASYYSFVIGSWKSYEFSSINVHSNYDQA